MGTAPREPRSLSSGTRWLDTRPKEHMDGRGRMWAPWRPRTRLHREAAAETAHPPPAPWLSLPGRVGQEQAALLPSGEVQLPPSPANLPVGGSPPAWALAPRAASPSSFSTWPQGASPGSPAPNEAQAVGCPSLPRVAHPVGATPEVSPRPPSLQGCGPSTPPAGQRIRVLRGSGPARVALRPPHS